LHYATVLNLFSFLTVISTIYEPLQHFSPGIAKRNASPLPSRRHDHSPEKIIKFTKPGPQHFIAVPGIFSYNK
jgi:hypothetical protein